MHAFPSFTKLKMHDRIKKTYFCFKAFYGLFFYKKSFIWKKSSIYKQLNNGSFF